MSRYKELKHRKYNLRPHSDSLRQGTREADPDYTSESNSDDEENLATDPSDQNKRQFINWSVDMNRFIMQTYETLENKSPRGRGYLNVLMHKKFCQAFPEIEISVKQLAYRRSLLHYYKNSLSRWDYFVNRPEDNISAKAHNKSTDTSNTKGVKTHSQVTRGKSKDSNENDHNVNDKNAVLSAFKGHRLLLPRVELQRYGQRNTMKAKDDNHFHTTKGSNSLSDPQNANRPKETNASSDDSDSTSNDTVWPVSSNPLIKKNDARSDSTSATDSDEDFHVNTPPETKLGKRQRINWSYDMDKYIWRTYLSLQKKGVRRFLRVLYEKFCRAFPETEVSLGQLAERRMLLALYNDEMTPWEKKGIINRQKRKKAVNAGNVSTGHPLHTQEYNLNRKRTFDDSSTSAKSLQHVHEILSKRNTTKDDNNEIIANHSDATKKNNLGTYSYNNLSNQQNMKIHEQTYKNTSTSAENSTQCHSFFYRICSGMKDVNTPIEDQITNVIDPSTNTSTSISTNIQNNLTPNPEMVIDNQKSSRVKIISQKILQASTNNATSESKNSAILANSTDTCSKTFAREILLTSDRHLIKYDNQSLTLNRCNYKRDSTYKIIPQKYIEGMPESSLGYSPFTSEITPATANQSSGYFIENTSTRKDSSGADISEGDVAIDSLHNNTRPVSNIDEASTTKAAVTTPGNISSGLPLVIVEQAVTQKFKSLFEQITCKLLDSFMENQEANQQFDETCNFAIELITSLSDLRKSINPVEPSETVMDSSTATDLKRTENTLVNCTNDTNLENMCQSATNHRNFDLKDIDRPSDEITSRNKDIEIDNHRNIDDSAYVLNSSKYISQEYTKSSSAKQKQTSDDNNCDVNNERKERLINDNIASTSTDIPREHEGATELNHNDEENNYDDNSQAVDDNEESYLIEIPNKKSKIILPADYDPNDSKWTLKYRHKAPGFIELEPGSGVYVYERELKIILNESRDCKTLARKLLSAVFTPRALSVCSLAGTRNSTGPGLDKHAVSVLLKYVTDTGRKYKLSPCPINLILQSMRGKLADTRRKFGTASNEFWADYNQ